MALYDLTINNDTFNGTTSSDTFAGPSGGSDVLRGYGGNDFFNILEGQTGYIVGGDGYDRVRLVGGNNFLDPGLIFSTVEQLIIETSNVFATVRQLAAFQTIVLQSNSDEFSFFLQGAGGVLDFTTKYTGAKPLNFEAEMATSAVTLTGSIRNDSILGSDFGDRLNGGKGVDEVRGGFGNDVINGGLGRDVLYGDDGFDYFVFDTALSGNYDRIGDFRRADDQIRLDRDIFDWDGNTAGTIKAEHFKIIGTGQTVDADDHIIYNQSNGRIYYDVDGAGGTAMVLFAILDNFSGDVPIVTRSDFSLI